MKRITRLVSLVSMIACIYMIVAEVLNPGTTILNPVPNMTSMLTGEIVPYKTEYVYNDSMSSKAKPMVLEEGINGLIFNSKQLSSVKNEIVEVGTGTEGEYTGTLTGYGPDCPGCSLVGNVSCLTREGTKHSLINDGVYYTDEKYGSVRIIATDNSLLPCGTIINIENSDMEMFTAIVLDTGYTMRNAWRNGIVWIDLAFSSEEDARNNMVTNKNTKFSVQRWGW